MQLSLLIMNRIYRINRTRFTQGLRPLQLMHRDLVISNFSCPPLHFDNFSDFFVGNVHVKCPYFQHKAHCVTVKVHLEPNIISKYIEWQSGAHRSKAYSFAADLLAYLWHPIRLFTDTTSCLQWKDSIKAIHIQLDGTFRSGSSIIIKL